MFSNLDEFSEKLQTAFETHLPSPALVLENYVALFQEIIALMKFMTKLPFIIAKNCNVFLLLEIILSPIYRRPLGAHSNSMLFTKHTEGRQHIEQVPSMVTWYAVSDRMFVCFLFVCLFVCLLYVCLVFICLLFSY